MSGGKQRRKSAAGSLKEWEADPTIHKLEAVRDWINAKLPNESATAKQLAQLAASIIQFQEDNLGRDSPSPRPHTKLPFKLFRDFSAGGALCQILLVALRFKNENSWRKIDFQGVAKKEKNLELIQRIENQLKVKSFSRIYDYALFTMYFFFSFFYHQLRLKKK